MSGHQGNIPPLVDHVRCSHHLFAYVRKNELWITVYTCIILLDDFFKVHTAATLRHVHSGTTTVLAGVNTDCGKKTSKRHVILRTIYTLHSMQGRSASRIARGFSRVLEC